MTPERAAQILEGISVSQSDNHGTTVMPGKVRDELDAADMLKTTDTGHEVDVEKLQDLISTAATIAKMQTMAATAAPTHFTIGPRSVVTIRGITYVLTTAHEKGVGWWNTEQGAVIDVAEATQQDALDAAITGDEEVYDREKSRALVGAINDSIDAQPETASEFVSQAIEQIRKIVLTLNRTDAGAVMSSLELCRQCGRDNRGRYPCQCWNNE